MPRSAPFTAAVLLTLVIATPAGAATGDPVREGQRNPAGGGDASRETQIIASTPRDAYGTRQSNKGAGGGAIYGCRAALLASRPADPASSTPCLRVNNLRGGKAFDFVFDEGPLGGIIQAGANLLIPKPNAAPFITNATATALGLNADRVDGRHAEQLIAEARAKQGLDADTLDGKDAVQLVAEAQSAPPACPAGLRPAAGACLETAPRPAADFAAAATACGADGRRLAPAAVLMAARALEGIDLGGGELAADVSAGQSIPLPAPLPAVDSPATAATVADDGTVGSAALTAATPFRCTTA